MTYINFSIDVHYSLMFESLLLSNMHVNHGMDMLSSVSNTVTNGDKLSSNVISNDPNTFASAAIHYNSNSEISQNMSCRIVVDYVMSNGKSIGTYSTHCFNSNGSEVSTGNSDYNKIFEDDVNNMHIVPSGTSSITTDSSTSTAQLQFSASTAEAPNMSSDRYGNQKNQVIRPSLSHMWACGTACMYGVFEASRLMATEESKYDWPVNFANGSLQAAEALSPISRYLVSVPACSILEAHGMKNETYGNSDEGENEDDPSQSKSE
jgi:hypothetical protein